MMKAIFLKMVNKDSKGSKPSAATFAEKQVLLTAAISRFEEAYRNYRDCGRLKRSDECTELKNAEKGFRSCYFDLYRRLPDYEFNEDGRLVNRKGPIYIDKDGPHRRLYELAVIT